MYYEERVMDGKLWCRSTPDGQWRSVSYDIILGRMILAERNLERCIEAHQTRTQPGAEQRKK